MNDILLTGRKPTSRYGALRRRYDSERQKCQLGATKFSLWGGLIVCLSIVNIYDLIVIFPSFDLISPLGKVFSVVMFLVTLACLAFYGYQLTVSFRRLTRFLTCMERYYRLFFFLRLEKILLRQCPQKATRMDG